ncbi:MAG: class A beta-lactamase [Sphingomonas sp.]|uniref:class A beta-lactamase n=1 Tax=Sphingomonas sp. TaxID=28214 RepID=UPI001ACCA3AF|nr:class A beta-lactamase [Sphingomonas sp.]MBN8807550.1 class A beta-lactamase [Sphingomonas sp.]
MTISRREAVMAGGAALLLPAATRGSDPRAKFIAGVRKLEAGLGRGARIGVQLIDPVSGRNASWRATERFPMCSTFKLLLAGQMLWRVDHGQEKLARELAVPATTLPNSPTTRAHAGGRLSIADLCKAAVTQSDNTAANLLLGTVGGPAGLTAFLRTTGDRVTRLDRTEPSLNEATPGDPRDTTTPGAMLETLRRLTYGAVLSAASRQQLVAWLRANTTGGERLAKGLPAGWAIGDKTGTGTHMSNNDVALIWPAGRATERPIFATVLLTGGAGDDALARNPVHAKIGAMIGELLGAG